MNNSIKCFHNKRNKTYKLKPNDVFHTHPEVAKIMINMCDINETDTVLDPCRGTNKVFYRNFPKCNKLYCEISEGKDFFDFKKQVDWVIGNPPYSLWDKWLEHTIEITNKFCYIFGNLNLTEVRLRKIAEKGFKITGFHICKTNYWFSPNFLVKFEKDKPAVVTFTGTAFKCPDCGTKCGRGRTIKGVKISPNICYKKFILQKNTDTK
jgi:hypothetical protein